MVLDDRLPTGERDISNHAYYWLFISLNNLDLCVVFRYPFSVREEAFPVNPNHKGLPTMKLAIRIFALTIVVAGAAAAATTPKTASAIPSHQSATAHLPVPECGPGIPGCGNGN